MDSHQAIYDAVRSRIGQCNPREAIEGAIREADIGHHAAMASAGVQAAAAQYERPSVLYRPKLYPDGNQYCALYGDDLMAGCAGFGDTPAEAMADFDRNWHNQRLGERCREEMEMEEEEDGQPPGND